MGPSNGEPPMEPMLALKEADFKCSPKALNTSGFELVF